MNNCAYVCALLDDEVCEYFSVVKKYKKSNSFFLEIDYASMNLFSYDEPFGHFVLNIRSSYFK